MNMLADEMKALSDDTVSYTVPPYTPFAHGLPAVLENSPHRFAITNGDGWEVSFFYYPFAEEAFIVGFRDGRHRRHTTDNIRNTDQVVEYDKWIPVELARNYWRFLVKEIGYKRIK